MSDPRSAAELPALRLKRNEDRRLHAGHLWIFSNEVDTQQTPLPKFQPGELVRVLAHNDRALGLAYVNPEVPDQRAHARDLEDARRSMAGGAHPQRRSRLRERLYPKPYYRLVYGESDGLPGLVVDRYGAACVVQIGTAGMEELKPEIARPWSRFCTASRCCSRTTARPREMEGLPGYVEAAKGRFDECAVVIEDGLEFQAPLAEGQKTGWFFDQAANRRALQKYVRKGARVLDVFSYVGAWGVRAAHGGAREVACVDSSAAALELAASNAERNGVKLATRQGRCLRRAGGSGKEGRALRRGHHRSAGICQAQEGSPKALAAYKRLNQLALQVMRRRRHSGVLLLFLSCERRRIAGCHRQGGAGCGASICRSRDGRPGAGSSGASGHPRDPLFESLFLSGQ